MRERLHLDDRFGVREGRQTTTAADPCGMTNKRTGNGKNKRTGNGKNKRTGNGKNNRRFFG
jgi:hypothetical protein